MKVIGITGGTGAGKSSLCEELKRCGAKIIDCDVIARRVVEKGEPALAEIKKAFGEEVLTDDGELDRKKMGAIVFSQPQKLECLNSITHKHIFAEMERQMSESTENIVVLDVPLLFQSDFPFNCDLTVAVVADREERISRIMSRDGIDRKTAEARMANQLTDEEYARLADVCFVNDGGAEKIKCFARELCRM